MKSRLVSFFLLYILIPLIVIPFLSLKTGNWYGLFGILFYYAGLLIVQFNQWLFFPIPLFFCCWYWYTYGFGVRDYVTLFFICFVTGAVIFKIKKQYARWVHKIIPEDEQSEDYNMKLEKMEQMIKKYKEDHPGEKVTHEVIDKIKLDIFFK